MSENPFQSPQSHSSEYAPDGGPPSFGLGYVKQVPVIASLMIAQGVLQILYALMMTGYAFFFTQGGFMPPGAQQNQEMMKAQLYIMAIVIGVLSGGLAIVAILHFIAAYFSFNYKHRIFGIGVMILGLGSSMTCYCAPTAIGLAVYGLIIYMNPAVIKAFELRKQGLTKDQILAHFPR